MDDGELVIRWSIRLAMLCYAAVMAMAIAGRRAPAATAASRWIWTIGCALFVGHVLSAFAYYHHWSHAHAFEDTKDKTLATVGLAIGWGIYVNHLFMVLWVADVAWSWLAPQSFRARPMWSTGLLHTFMLFIAVNGLMVFKAGATRWVSLAVCAALAVCWAATLVIRRNSSQHHRLTATPEESTPS